MITNVMKKLLGIGFAGTALLQPSFAQTPTMREAMQLSNIELVTQMDPGTGGGGFDTTSDFDRRLVASVVNCIDQVLAVCQRWAQKHEVSLVKQDVERDRRPRSVFLQYASTEPVGLFEIAYRVGEGRAQARFWFYDLTGKALSGELTRYRGLGSELLEAMQCSPSSPRP